MFPPFPQELARHYCQKLISYLEDGTVVLEQTGRESEERKGQGLMIGSLVCWKKNAEAKSSNFGNRVVLFAVSGNNKKLSFAFEKNRADSDNTASSELIKNHFFDF